MRGVGRSGRTERTFRVYQACTPSTGGLLGRGLRKGNMIDFDPLCIGGRPKEQQFGLVFSRLFRDCVLANHDWPLCGSVISSAWGKVLRVRCVSIGWAPAYLVTVGGPT